jgi:hypothetical protein
MPPLDQTFEGERDEDPEDHREQMKKKIFE